MSCMRSFALTDPVVDKVDFNCVMSEPCRVFTIDLNTARKEDFNFVSAYKVTVSRQNYVHALCVWFDAIFSACHTPITLSTSPKEHYTHWKQVIF